MPKTPLYFIPGLAASASIFENLRLDPDVFETFFIEWTIPYQGETLQAYSQRMAKQITHPNPVLIGVSFGGILAQEIGKLIPTRKIIIISSIKSHHELPKLMLWAKKLKCHKWFPIHLIQHIEYYAPYIFRTKINQNKIQLYQKYLPFRDKNYLRWSIQQILFWEQEKPIPNLVHIHGSRDEIFPLKYIQDCIVLEKGTHIMILNKSHWISQKLSEIIM